jgi:hypothetical protein
MCCREGYSKVSLKSPRQVQSCKQHSLGAPLPPPKPVPARWGIWVEAINIYSEVCCCQAFIWVCCFIVLIQECIQWSKSGLHPKQFRLNSREYKTFPLQESVYIIKHASEKLCAVKVSTRFLTFTYVVLKLWKWLWTVGCLHPVARIRSGSGVSI